MDSNKTVKTSKILELIKHLEMEIAVVEQKIHFVVKEEVNEQIRSLSRNISSVEKDMNKLTKEIRTDYHVRNTEVFMKHAASM